jgi:hypothetical protein
MRKAMIFTSQPKKKSVQRKPTPPVDPLITSSGLPHTSLRHRFKIIYIIFIPVRYYWLFLNMSGPVEILIQF